MKTYLLLPGPAESPPMLRAVSSNADSTVRSPPVGPSGVTPLVTGDGTGSGRGGIPAADVPIDVKIRDIAERLKLGYE